jgi:hypothetical protein
LAHQADLALHDCILWFYKFERLERGLPMMLLLKRAYAMRGSNIKLLILSASLISLCRGQQTGIDQQLPLADSKSRSAFTHLMPPFAAI